jgi:DNA-binding transcriptional LysR family regulator
MDTSDIKLIRTVAEHGSLTRAADVLCMSQPTLSKKLGRLESQLKAVLFCRSPTGVTPTEIGRYIISSGITLQAQVARIERHVQQLVNLEQGEVRLGVGPIIEQVLLPEVLPQFVMQTGDVQLSIVTQPAEILVSRLYDAELDVIAGPLRPADYPDLIGIPLISDTLIRFARADHPLFSAKSQSGARGYPFASPLPQGSLREVPEEYEFSDKRITSENYPLLKKLILQSDCIGGAPRSVVLEELDQGVLRELITDQVVVWESACLVRPESLLTPLVKRLVDLLVSASQLYVSREP